MNIQELIEKYEYLNHAYFRRVDTNEVLRDLKQLDEPQKVTIPQFVANWIANVKRNGIKQKNTFGFYEEIEPNDNVYRVMYYIFKEGIAEENVKKWVFENPDTFARAWLDGYTVEKEKRYRVKMKNIHSESEYLYYGMGSCKWRFREKNESGYFRKNHTCQELEDAGFGWVFDCPGIEIEEVTE